MVSHLVSTAESHGESATRTEANITGARRKGKEYGGRKADGARRGAGGAKRAYQTTPVAK